MAALPGALAFASGVVLLGVRAVRRARGGGAAPSRSDVCQIGKGNGGVGALEESPLVEEDKELQVGILATSSSAPCLPDAPSLTSSTRRVLYPFAVRNIAGRGRGLVALRDIAAGEDIARFAAFGHVLYDDPGPDDTGRPSDEVCATCLRWGAALPVRCQGCPAVYCTDECRAAADLKGGHQLCCGAIGRISRMKRNSAKFTAQERAAACFLLRALARRRAMAASSPESDGRCGADWTRGRQEPEDGGMWRVDPSFADAVGQCQEADCIGEVSDQREASHARVLKLAKIHAVKLVKGHEAASLRLLRGERCNCFHLFDTREGERGSVIYPQASLVNHSCVPNCAAVPTGDALHFVALRAIVAGEELTYSYLRSFVLGGRETLSPWGFECACPRCAGTIPTTQLTAFDDRHKCVCGKIVIAAKAAQARSAQRCRCHSHNAVRPPAHAARQQQYKPSHPGHERD